MGSDLTLGLRAGAVRRSARGGGAVSARGAARPAALFERQNFTSADTTRAAAMIAWYAIGVWAFCAGPVLVRAFYAIGDRADARQNRHRRGAREFRDQMSIIWPLGEIALRGFDIGRCHVAGRSAAPRGSRARLSPQLAATLGHGVDERSQRRLQCSLYGPGRTGTRPQSQSHRQRNRARRPAARLRESPPISPSTGSPAAPNSACSSAGNRSHRVPCRRFAQCDLALHKRNQRT